MPDPTPSSSATTQSAKDDLPAYRPMVLPVRRDLAGHPLDNAPEPRTDGCGHGARQSRGATSQTCPRHAVPDPSSVVPLILALIAGTLIIVGVLTAIGRGPGKLIRPKPRRRGATKRARRMRRATGSALIVAGFVVIGLIFV
jgi:hypothetical protein